MKTRCCNIMLVLITVFLLLQSSQAAEEFTSKVKFDSYPFKPKMADFKGKCVIILFYQGKYANEWSPAFFTQMEKSYSTDRRFVLIALKTDDKDVKAATDYFKTKGGKPELWLMGVDPEAIYYKKLTKESDQWNVAIISAEGTYTGCGLAAVTYTGGPNIGQYFYASKTDILKNAGKPVTVLPAEKEYAAELMPIVRAMEFGHPDVAMKLCTAAFKGAKDPAALKELSTTIEAACNTRIQTLMDTCKDEKKDMGDRYDAYKTLDTMTRELATLKKIEEVKPLLVTAIKNPAMRKEFDADKAFQKAMDMALKAKSDQNKELARKALMMVSTSFKGTKYGDRAETEALLIGK